MKAMILAAGYGTRMQPLTLTRPKALIEVNGVTLLERNIRYLMAYGVTELVINVHHFATQIIQFLAEKQHFGINIHISDETDAVLETGGGLKRAAPMLMGTQPFFLMNVDMLTDLSLEALWAFHHRQPNALATLAVTARTSSRQLLFDSENTLKGWKNLSTAESILHAEESTLQPKAFSGIHLLSPDIFSHLHDSGKFSIIPAYLSLSNTHKILGFDHSGGKLLDVGKPEAIAVAEAMFG